MAQIIRLRENELKQVLSEVVKRVINTIVENEENVIVRQASNNDYWTICELTSKIEGANSIQTVDSWFTSEGGLNIDASFVAENKKGKIIGACTSTNGTIDEETPDMKSVQPELYEKLSKLKYLMGFGFFIEKEYRGGNLARKFMNSLLSAAKSNNYDFVVVPVYRHLKTHNMYLRSGCIPFHINYEEDVIYYLYPINKNVANIVRRYARIPEIKKGNFRP